jgi:hypothetical protein
MQKYNSYGDEKSIKTFSNATKSSMSLISSRLDLSNLFSTKKRSCCDSNKALIFSDRQKLAFVRDGNNKD